MAETRPATMDDMARIGGVGAKKLERYGASFPVITGDIPETARPAVQDWPEGRRLGLRPPSRRSIPLLRGPDGTGKPMSCSASLLAKIAALDAGARPDWPSAWRSPSSDLATHLPRFWLKVSSGTLSNSDLHPALRIQEPKMLTVIFQQNASIGRCVGSR